MKIERGLLDLHRLHELTFTAVSESSETQVFLRTTGGILSGLYHFLELSLVRTEITYLEEITILGINESEGWGSRSCCANLFGESFE